MATPACSRCGEPLALGAHGPAMCAACSFDAAMVPDEDPYSGAAVLPPGSLVGPFEIVRLLGTGGMAVVYEAYEAALARVVALKILPPHLLHDETFAARFTREARVAAGLEHPNIVPIYASGIHDGLPWMSMRLLMGGSFARSHRGGTALLNIALRQRSSARDCVTVTRGFSLVHKQSHSRYHPVSRVVAPRRHPAHLAVLAARLRVHTNSRASPVGRRARRAGRSPSAAKRRASVLDAAIDQHCHPRTRSTSRRSLSLAQQFWYAPIPFGFNKPH
jgi:hypothetical protein